MNVQTEIKSKREKKTFLTLVEDRKPPFKVGIKRWEER